LGADTRAKGLESDPADVLVFDVAARPGPADADGKIIDAALQQRPPIIEASSQPDQEEMLPPVKRGRGRPKGSRNKPKVQELPNDKLTEREPSVRGVPGFEV
jgi:hypothetical protein